MGMVEGDGGRGWWKGMVEGGVEVVGVELDGGKGWWKGMVEGGTFTLVFNQE